MEHMHVLLCAFVLNLNTQASSCMWWPCLIATHTVWAAALKRLYLKKKNQQNKTHIEAQSTTKYYLLFSKEAMVVTKVDQRLVIELKAAKAISHSKALQNCNNKQ